MIEPQQNMLRFYYAKKPDMISGFMDYFLFAFFRSFFSI